MKTSLSPLVQSVASAILQELKVAGHEPPSQLPNERLQACRLGVSRATINRALRHLEERGIVTRRQGSGTYLAKHVSQDILEEVRYETASPVALKLRSEKPRRIERMRYHIAFLHDQEPTSPLFAVVFAGVYDYARSRGHYVSLGPARPDSGKTVPTEFSWEAYHSSADAMILSCAVRKHDRQNLAKIRVPYVCVSQCPGLSNSISSDSSGTCHQAVDELVTMGHRRIAVLDMAKPGQSPGMQAECEALAHEHAGIAEIRHFGWPKGIEKLTADPWQPTGIFARDFICCRELCDRLAAARRVIGSDVDVITATLQGYDPVLPLEVGRIEVDFHEVGCQAAQLLERRIEDRSLNIPPVRVGGQYVPGKHLGSAVTESPDATDPWKGYAFG